MRWCVTICGLGVWNFQTCFLDGMDLADKLTAAKEYTLGPCTLEWLGKKESSLGQFSLTSPFCAEQWALQTAGESGVFVWRHQKLHVAICNPWCPSDPLRLPIKDVPKYECLQLDSIHRWRPCFHFLFLRCVISVRLWHCHRFFVILPNVELCRCPILAIACMFPLLHLLQRHVACHVAWWRLSCFVGGLCWFAPPRSPLLLALFCTRTRGRWFSDDSYWFNDQYAVKDGTNASKSILSTWISNLFVGLWGPCLGHLDLRFSLDKGPFYAKGECVNVDSLLISTERFAYHVFRNGFEKTGERSACGSPQQTTGGLCLSPKWSHNFNACARFKA